MKNKLVCIMKRNLKLSWQIINFPQMLNHTQMLNPNSSKPLQHDQCKPLPVPSNVYVCGSFQVWTIMFPTIHFPPFLCNRIRSQPPGKRLCCYQKARSKPLYGDLKQRQTKWMKMDESVWTWMKQMKMDKMDDRLIKIDENR